MAIICTASTDGFKKTQTAWAPALFAKWGSFSRSCKNAAGTRRVRFALMLHVTRLKPSSSTACIGGIRPSSLRRSWRVGLDATQAHRVEMPTVQLHLPIPGKVKDERRLRLDLRGVFEESELRPAAPLCGGFSRA
eukprot:CAMPEP_0114675874 /NCGR_PEP_ID=MMETSP0191-20121206/48492_1 /TAXON_ID=126664 /ORGANISM="Sorites sp." /LENGTH=134 /DNA_ID=CAMNT_0001945949 /DNA_START=210 /DNA_END=610 /DNA_ORIENTATION=+